MAVCSTPSSPLSPGVPGMVPLLKFRFTGGNRERTEDRARPAVPARSPAQGRSSSVPCGPGGQVTHSW